MTESFTTQVTYNGKKVRPAIHWNIVVSATRDANGNIVYGQ